MTSPATPTGTATCANCGRRRPVTQGHVDQIPVEAVYCEPCDLSTIFAVLDEPLTEAAL